MTLGVMNTQTADAPAASALATNYSVVRLKQDILRRSSISALFTGRSLSTLGDGSSQTYGLDGGLAFYDNLSINTYWAKWSCPGFVDTSPQGGVRRCHDATFTPTVCS